MKTTDAPDTTGTDLLEIAKPVGKTNARNVVFLSAFLLMAIAAISFTLRHHPVGTIKKADARTFIATRPIYHLNKQGKLIIMPNPQVAIGGAYVSCPGTTTLPPSGAAWQVLNSVGTQVDSGASTSTNGANNLFNVGPPPSAGGAVNVKALAGATVGAGYTFRSIGTSGASSGPFDVVAGGPTVPTAPGTLTMTIT